MTAAMKFTALDFETATDDRGSVCAVGIAKVEGGEIIATRRILVSPPDGSGAPAAPGSQSWHSAYETIMDMAKESILVAHNASLNMSVMLNACSLEDIDWPEAVFVCTMELSKQLLSLPSHTLPWVTDALYVDYPGGNEPLDRAVASAQILLALAKSKGHVDLDGLTAAVPSSRIATIFEDAEGSPDADEARSLIGAELRGHTVCFTGALKSMTRKAAQNLVAEHGGIPQSDPTAKTTILVTGDFDMTRFRPGAEFSTKLQKVMDMASKGAKVEILTEDDFFSRLAVTKEELRRHAAGFKRTKLPPHILDQAEHRQEAEDYWSWFRRMLQHPQGRARNGDSCVWCEEPISGSAHWVYRDRHVCSGTCNDALKRSAKRAWYRTGIEY